MSLKVREGEPGYFLTIGYIVSSSTEIATFVQYRDANSIFFHGMLTNLGLDSQFIICLHFTSYYYFFNKLYLKLTKCSSFRRLTAGCS